MAGLELEPCNQRSHPTNSRSEQDTPAIRADVLDHVSAWQHRDLSGPLIDRAIIYLKNTSSPSLPVEKRDLLIGLDRTVVELERTCERAGTSGHQDDPHSADEEDDRELPGFRRLQGHAELEGGGVLGLKIRGRRASGDAIEGA
jgi:hypothetical protein